MKKFKGGYIDLEIPTHPRLLVEYAHPIVLMANRAPASGYLTGTVGPLLPC